MRKEKSRITADPALSTRPSDNTESTDRADSFDYDKRIVDSVDASIWSALFDGHFRLAVRCERCGRWLTAGVSKRNRLGAHCKAKAAEQ